MREPLSASSSPADSNSTENSRDRLRESTLELEKHPGIIVLSADEIQDEEEQLFQ